MPNVEKEMLRCLWRSCAKKEKKHMEVKEGFIFTPFVPFCLPSGV
jgi:hypothetical protein